MSTVVLTFIALFCLGYSHIPFPFLLLFCLPSFLFFHSHKEGGSRITCDVLAQSSTLSNFSPMEKFFFTLLCMICSITSKTPATGCLLLVIMPILGVFSGGIKLKDYLHYLTLPAAFLMLSGLALLFEYMRIPSGVIQIPFFDGYLCVTTATQKQTGFLLIKALASLSCLCFFSLTTPMHEIIGVLHKLKFPKLMIELMYLIYRCIFILFAMYDAMKYAAKSRLGFYGYTTSIRTLGLMYANILAKSYGQAMQMFDAMESRCYDGTIAFLTASYVKKRMVSFTMAAIVLTSIMTLL